MKINLKALTQQKEQLKYAQYLANKHGYKKETNKLKELIKFLEEVEVDLELGGESIVELDKSRLEAIEERNKYLHFLKMGDDI